jgi:hypothetical protein
VVWLSCVLWFDKVSLYSAYCGGSAHIASFFKLLDRPISIMLIVSCLQMVDCDV